MYDCSLRWSRDASIDANPRRAYSGLYASHRRCFPAPVVRRSTRARSTRLWRWQDTMRALSSGRLKVVSVGSRAASAIRHHEVALLGMPCVSGNEQASKLEAVQIDCELGRCKPGDPMWGSRRRSHFAQSRIMYRSYALQLGTPCRRRALLRTRNCLDARHPRGVCLATMFGTQFSNQLITKGKWSRAAT